MRRPAREASRSKAPDRSHPRRRLHGREQAPRARTTRVEARSDRTGYRRSSNTVMNRCSRPSLGMALAFAFTAFGCRRVVSVYAPLPNADGIESTVVVVAERSEIRAFAFDAAGKPPLAIELDPGE